MCEKGSKSAEKLQPTTERFSYQMNQILNEYVAIYRVLLERQHTVNETRLQPGGYMFPFLSSTHYIPVPPPDILSSYLRGETGLPIQDAFCRRMESRNFPRSLSRNDNVLSTVDVKNNINDTKKAVNSTSNVTAIADVNHRRQSFQQIHDKREETTFKESSRDEKMATNFSYYGNNKVPPPRRRPYTASELASAVQAICSGQLGTRRAASVYGIPRSTLRNKICKLNEIRRHEETRRGGRHISLAELIKQYSSTGASQSDRYSSSRVASVFKVNCRAIPVEPSERNSMCRTTPKKQIGLDLKDMFPRGRHRDVL